MGDLILRTCEWLGRILAPGTGRRRAQAARTGSTRAPFTVLPELPVWGEKQDPDPVPGEPVPRIRPYFEAFEQQARREAMEAALFGIDLGPEWIHGVRVGGVL